jgi:hypothetical protein
MLFVAMHHGVAGLVFSPNRHLEAPHAFLPLQI